MSARTRRKGWPSPAAGAVLLVGAAMLLTACASTSLGKAIQSASIQKQLVEVSAVEFIKLHLKGDLRITPDVYAQAKEAYGRYYESQAVLASALATWKAVSDEPNEARLVAAINRTKTHIDVYLTFVSRFIDLSALKSKIGG